MALGIALFSYNRPEYLDQVLESLINNKGFNPKDLVVFQDYANDRSHEACLPLYAKYNLGDRVKVAVKNKGVAVNQFEGYQYMFNRYDEVLLLEDDMVLSSNYIELIEKMLKQFMPDKSVFFVRGGALDLGGDDMTVTAGNPHQWGHAFNKERWEAIRKHYMPLYERFYEDVVYSERDGQAIQAVTGDHVTSQDATKKYCAQLAGYTKGIVTTKPRAKYIGAKGVHFRPRAYARYGFGEIQEIERPILTKFKLIDSQ